MKYITFPYAVKYNGVHYPPNAQIKVESGASEKDTPTQTVPTRQSAGRKPKKPAKE